MHLYILCPALICSFPVLAAPLLGVYILHACHKQYTWGLHFVQSMVCN